MRGGHLSCVVADAVVCVVVTRLLRSLRGKVVTSDYLLSLLQWLVDVVVMDVEVHERWLPLWFCYVMLP
jgi:hypothetical protein